MGPQRTDPLLAPLATEADLERSIELHISRTDAEDLLDTGSRVEESEEEGVVSLSFRPVLVDGLQHRTDLISFKVLNGLDAGTLDGNGEEPLAHLDVLGMSHGNESGKRVDR